MHLLSTVVAPSFEDCHIRVEKIQPEHLAEMLGYVTVNAHDHQPTIHLLRTICPTLPFAPVETAAPGIIWNGQNNAIAVRAKGGVDVAPDSIDQLEFALVIIHFDADDCEEDYNIEMEHDYMLSQDDLEKVARIIEVGP